METKAHDLRELPLSQVQPSPLNAAANRANDPSLPELAQSIREQGLIQPITVREVPSKKGEPGHFEIVAGERRWRASKLAGLETIPAIVREISDEKALEIILVENLQREGLSPLAEAEGYRQLLRIEGHNADSIAAKIGRSAKYVYDRIKLLSLTKESQELLRESSITAGHAILLARLTPTEQARAIEEALFVDERSLFTEEEREAQEEAINREAVEARKRRAPKEEVDAIESRAERLGMKAISVRELEAWIDEHVRFDRAQVDPMLFPETAATVTAAAEEKLKVVPITHSYYVDPAAKDGSRTFGPMSWKRADGRADSKICDHSVLGVIVVGPGRGDSFRVCVDKKKCSIHWAQEKRTAAKRTSTPSQFGGPGANEAKAAQAKRDAEHERLTKARPVLLAAFAFALKKADVKPGSSWAKALVSTHYGKLDKEQELLPAGKSCEDLVRHLVWLDLLDNELGSWQELEGFQRAGKSLGVDVAKILETVAPKPVQTSAAAKPKAKSKPAAKPKSKAPAKKAAKKSTPKKKAA